MHYLPLIVAIAAAFVIAPSAISALASAGVVRENYRGALIPSAAGLVVVAAALIAIGPLAALDQLADTEILRSGLGPVLLYVLGVAVLGLADDLLGGRAPAGAEPSPEAPRGWRGHASAAAHGRLSTGALKAVGSLGLALFVLAGDGRSWAEYLLSVAVLLLATNLFNLLDLRPGRAIKALVGLAAALTLFGWDLVPLETLGLLLGPVLVLAPYDLRERAMLGDVGSNVLGAIAGFWLVLTLNTFGQAIALAVLVAITVYAEFRSLSALIEKNPLLRRLDSWGRLSPPADSHHYEPKGGTDG
jgi:UDP-N-acetylmuramyl pentapeptide phosphotransferase/UDP-N-acetylglucosamine-1-phosphate transferase